MIRTIVSTATNMFPAPFQAFTIWILTVAGKTLTAMAMPGVLEWTTVGRLINKVTGPTIIRTG